MDFIKKIIDNLYFIIFGKRYFNAVKKTSSSIYTHYSFHKADADEKLEEEETFFFRDLE